MTEELPKGREQLLVIDDEPALLELALDSLSALGYSVLTAGSAKEGLDLLSKNPDVRLLFCDVVMPGPMNGYELSEAALKLYPDLKVLLTSGYSREEMSFHGFDALPVELLRKPYSLKELARRIRKLLDEDDCVN